MSQYGCYLCGSKESPVLTAQQNPYPPNVGAALCGKCNERYDKEGPVILAPKPQQ